MFSSGSSPITAAELRCECREQMAKPLLLRAVADLGKKMQQILQTTWHVQTTRGPP